METEQRQEVSQRVRERASERKRERERVCGVWKGVCVCVCVCVLGKHIVTVSHIQASPTDAPCSQVLSQLITLPETTPHCQEFTAKSNNYFADLGDYCIMGAYSHTVSSDCDPQVKIVSLIIINNGTTAAFQSCESKSLKLLQELLDFIVWKK